MRARSFCDPTERFAPSSSSSYQRCTADRTSPILTPRKEAEPLRYLVHHSRVVAVARAFKRNCSLSMRSSSTGTEELGRFIDRSLRSRPSFRSSYDAVPRILTDGVEMIVHMRVSHPRTIC